MIVLSTRLKVIAGATALSLLAAPAGFAVARADDGRPAEISYDASQMDADGKTHVMHLKDVTITYGSMTVRADRALATAGDFKNSRWTLDGNVRINAEPRGNLRSDEAIVEFQDNQLLRATATGNPAEFDQKRADSNVVTHGKANEIVYEVGPGTVRLTSDAYITDGQNDISGPLLVYSLRDEKLQATTSPGSDQRVRVTIAPNEGKPGGSKSKITVAPDSRSSPTATTPQASAAGPATPQSGAASQPGAVSQPAATPAGPPPAAASPGPGTPPSGAGAGTPPARSQSSPPKP
ncbi:MAG TPA: lipopolysaccharide transport periplasmic protein LptA [Steroidobacteraceae bacterium]|nr:lipopolysaccharide transport periplasmic protein LptA [Steroidobacteraceae bacterium]